MARGVNKVILVGNLGKDPEVRYTTSGAAVSSVSIATTSAWKDKSGEQQESTEWHNLVFFGRLGEVVGEYLKKGSQIYAEGRLQTRKWQDKEGHDRYTTEVVVNDMQMLGGRGEGGGGGFKQAPPAAAASSSSSAAASSATAAKAPADDFDDDIPF